MSTKNKLKQFEEIKRMHNVFEHPVWNEEFVVNDQWGKIDIKHNWSKIFGNENPITLELACGKGEYAIALAEAYPDINFIGMDTKGNRLWHGAKQASEKKLKNVVFLRADVIRMSFFFLPKSIAEIWITFADPYPNLSDIKRRLVSPRFMQIFLPLMKEPARFHLKHDSEEYYMYCKETLLELGGKVLIDLPNVYANHIEKTLVQEIQTFYEKSHLQNGRIIKYLHWEVPFQ